MQTFENILMFKHFYSLIFQFFSLLSLSLSSGFWLLLGLCIERFLGTIKVLVFAVAQTLSISPSSITVIMRSPLYQTGEWIEFLLLAFSSLFFCYIAQKSRTHMRPYKKGSNSNERYHCIVFHCRILSFFYEGRQVPNIKLSISIHVHYNTKSIGKCHSKKMCIHNSIESTQRVLWMI